MNFIYKIWVLGLVCLSSINVFAQLEITPDTINMGSLEKTGTIFDCMCQFESDVDRFHSVLATIENRKRQEWLEKKEQGFKKEIEKRMNKTYPNFDNAQRDYFKRRVFKQQHKSLLEGLRKKHTNSYNGEKNFISKQVLEAKSLDYRKRMRDTYARRNFGSLKSGNKYIRNMRSTTELDSRIDALYSQARDLAPVARQKSKISDGMNKIQDELLDRVVSTAMDDYNGKDRYNRVVLMIKYLINDYNNAFYPYVNYSNPKPITTSSHNFEPIAIDIANNLGTVRYGGFPTDTDREAVKQYAIRTLGSKESIFITNTKHLQKEVGDFLQNHSYSQTSLDHMKKLISNHIAGKPFDIAEDRFVSNGTPAHTQRSNDRKFDSNFALGWRADGDIKHEFLGFGNVLNALYRDYPNNKLEGNIIRKMFTANKIDVGTIITDEELGIIFEIPKLPISTTPRFQYFIDINFTNNAGQELVYIRETFPSFLETELGVDSAVGYATDKPLNYFLERTIRDIKKYIPLSANEENRLRKINIELLRKINSLVNRNATEADKKEGYLTITQVTQNGSWISSTGKIDGKSDFEYNAFRDWKINGEAIREFRLVNGDFMARGNYRICSSCSESEDRTYYRRKSSARWFHYVSKPSTYTASDLDFIFEKFWDGAKFVGSYIIPLEDLIIVIDGKDFHGQEVNRYLAGGMLIVGVVPGSKFFTAPIKIAKGVKAWKLAVKAGNKTINLGYKVVDGFVTFGSRGRLAEIIVKKAGEEAHHMIPWALRNDDVIQEAAYAGFHMNKAVNGKALKKFSNLTPDGIHGNHPAYNDVVKFFMNEFKEQTGNLTPEIAKDYLEIELVPILDNLIDEAIRSKLTLNEFFKQVVKPRFNIP